MSTGLSQADPSQGGLPGKRPPSVHALIAAIRTYRSGDAKPGIDHEMRLRVCIAPAHRRVFASVMQGCSDAHARAGHDP